MQMRMTLAELEKLKAAGKIQGFSVKRNQKSTTVKIKARNKTKDWIEKNLWHWAKANHQEMIREHQFHPDRKWRFDWVFPKLMTAVEYEGLMSEKSRHTTIEGYTGDVEKYNQAQQLGWKVLRYTAKNYKQIIDDLNKLL
jgi:very-short-patch-repair endonuclease